jgi:hypothetical protein
VSAMTIGVRTTTPAFTGSKKSDALSKGIRRLLCTWLVLLPTKFPFVGFMVVIGNITGINFLASFESIAHFIRDCWGIGWMIVIIVAASFIWPILQVFVFHRPLTIRGLYEKFRYVSSRVMP